MIFFETNALKNTPRKILLKLYSYNQLTTCDESLISTENISNNVLIN